jgi:hypothetical protein
MPETPWSYYIGDGPDPERYDGPHDTRALAIARGIKNGWETATVREARPEELGNDIFQAQRVLEDFYETNDIFADPETGKLHGPITRAQERELENALAETFGAWRVRHGIGRAWTLEFRVESGEVVTLTEIKES